MRAHNGGEGFIGDGSYLRLWPVEELVEQNRTLAPARPKSVILIGSDGADDLFAVEPAGKTHNYLVFPRIELTPKGDKLANSWNGFLEALARRQ
jgi:hypothetical protein